MNKNTLNLTCPNIPDGGKFPIDNTGRGADVSPEFILHNLTPEAKSLVVTLEDQSHPIKSFTHWIIWNIPAADVIPGAISAGKIVNGMVQGLGYGLHKYAGPKPPKGKSHKYCFTVYTLDCFIDAKPSSTKAKVLAKASGHILQQGRISAYFE